jgi:hypothetical protein
MSSLSAAARTVLIAAAALIASCATPTSQSSAPAPETAPTAAPPPPPVGTVGALGRAGGATTAPTTGKRPPKKGLVDANYCPTCAGSKAVCLRIGTGGLCQPPPCRWDDGSQIANVAEVLGDCGACKTNCGENIFQ